MHIVLGGTGHIGGAVARTLLARGAPVTVVGRDRAAAPAWEAQGARFAAVDVTDVAALNAVLRTGTSAFLLNPPGDPAGDSDAAERASGTAIVAALAGSGLTRVVAQSTYGARAGDRIGDLSTLYDMELALQAQPIPVAIVRAAYLFTKWDAQLPAARDGTIAGPLAADRAMPMVSPADVGRVAAGLLVAPTLPTGPIYVEGPQPVSPREVADTFAAALGRAVRYRAVPRAGWTAMYRDFGFSEASAVSFTRLAEVTANEDVSAPVPPVRGTTTIAQHVAALVA